MLFRHLSISGISVENRYCKKIRTGLPLNTCDVIVCK